MGAVLGERFVLQARAGAGGAATVYRALDRASGAIVAVKLMTAADGPVEERFEREARTLAELSHPGLVRYIAHGVDGGARYLVMEWLEGVDLSQRLARGPLAVAEAVAMVRRAAEALATLHARGIVHRDVKPSNMFLVDGRTDRVKVVDFGLARPAGDGSVTMTGVAIGTPRFMAPEQVRGRRDLDARVDVYGLGGVLYTALTGRPAFAGADHMAILARVLLEEPTPVRELVPDVPVGLDELVGEMMAKDRMDRPVDAAAVIGRLDAIASSIDLDAAPPPSIVAVTGGEQRLLSVVLVSDLGERTPVVGPELDDTDATQTGTHGATTALAEVIARHRARFVRLPDKSWVVTLVGTGPATDQAAHAARLALSLRQQAPTAIIALATGSGQIARRLPTGDVIDRAAQLLHRARDGGRHPIAVDEVTAELLGERFALRRGSDGVELVAELGGDRARTLLGVATACVGREAELGTLQAVWNHVVLERTARVVLVTGEAGVGKSRVRHELLRRLGEEPEVWMGRGDPMRAGAAFALLAPAIRAAAGIRDDEPIEERRAKLRARVERRVAPADAERVAAFVGELVGTPFPDDNLAPLRTARHDPRLMNDHLRQAWIDWVAAETEDAPLLIVLEDLHWGDRPTVKFIDALLGALAERPIMVLALARPEVKSLLPGLWEARQVTELPLGSLSRRASERLVRDVLGDRASGDTVARLVEQAAGNALFLEELIRAVAERKGDALPASVLAMVQARLDRLPAEARRVLRAASVFSNVFWASGVAALVGGDLAVGEWIEFLLAQEVLSRRPERRFAAEDELVFRHALVRDAAYSLLTDADRQLGHRHAAAWLERVGETDPLVLAEHLERGGELERAAAQYLRAADIALEGSDPTAAVTRAAQGLACLDLASAPQLHPVRGALHLVQAQAYSWSDQFAEQEVAARRALACLAAGSPAYCRALGEVAHACGHVGNQDALLAIGEELASLGATRATERAFVVAASSTSTFLILFGHFAVADRLLALIQPALDAFQGADPAVAGAILRVKAMRAQSREHIADCMEFDRDSVIAFERAGDQAAANRQRGNQAAALLALGDYAGARDILIDSMARAERLRLQSVAAVAHLNLGFTLELMGEDGGLALLERAVGALRDLGMRRIEAEGRANVAAALLRRGDLAGALREVDRGIEIAASFPPSLVYVLAQRAQVLIAAGRAADALTDARRAHEMLVVLGGLDRAEGEPLVRLVFAEALAAAGDVAGARAAIAAARARLEQVAANIADPAWRASYLERVAVNARTLELDQRWNPTR